VPKKSEAQEKNSRYANLIGTHQPIMLQHKTQLFASVVLFSNGQIALPSMGLLAPDHLRQDICSPYRHQPHHRPIWIFGWMDSYMVLAAALFFIPSLWFCECYFIFYFLWPPYALAQVNGGSRNF